MEKLLELLRAACTEQLTVLNGLETTLPEPWKTELTQLRGEFDKVLAKMPESEKASAALNADAGLNYLALAVQRVMDINKNLSAMLQRMSSDHAQELAGLDGRIASALEAKVAAGELVPKAAAEAREAEAVKAAQSAWDARAARHKARAEQLVACGLREPADAKWLDEADEAWAAGLAAAQERAAKLKGLGLELASAEAARLAWAPQEEFERHVKVIDLVLASRPAAAAPAAPDPMLAGGAGGSDKKRKAFV